MMLSLKFVVALLTLAAISTASVASAQTAMPARTQIKLFTPFHQGSLSVGVAATDQGSGSCFARSVASAARPDAWRCTMGNAVLDPCFANVMGDGKTLACARDPWSANVTLLTLTAPLPEAKPDTEPIPNAVPWALELANGRHCTLFTGATAPVAGMRINYGCTDGAIVVGDIDRSQPQWRVFSQGEKSPALEMNDISVAWY